MSDIVKAILGPKMLERLEGETGMGHGLPRGAYVDREFHKLEFERYLSRTWLFVGFAHEIPNAGDALPIPGLPIVLVRSRDGKINAFHNVCRHRGFKLVDQPCHGKARLVCPYHGWTYDLDGKLVGTPQFFGHGKHTDRSFEYGDHGLKSIRCGIWHDWVFLNLDGKAEEFEDFIAPLAQRLEQYELSKVKPLFTVDMGEFKVNWKLMMENALDCLHDPVVHGKSCPGLPLVNTFMLEEGLGERHLVGSYYLDKQAVDALDTDDKTATISAPGCMYFYALLPNTTIYAFGSNMIYAHLITPHVADPEKTYRKSCVYTTADTLPSERDIADLHSLVMKLEYDEDAPLWPRLQEGRNSPVMDDGGVLSPYWDQSIKFFYKELVTAIETP